MKDKEIITIDRVHYSNLNLTSDKDGNIVLIHIASFAPLEYYEWGINSEKQFYECYQWCENDFFEDSNYYKIISKEEMIKELDNIISLLLKNSYTKEANEYKDIRNKLNENKTIMN